MERVAYKDLSRAQQLSILPIIRSVLLMYHRMPNTVVHVKHGLAYDLYIGRKMPGYPAKGWGNPFSLKEYTRPGRDEQMARALCIQDYIADLFFGSNRPLLSVLWTLKGKRLGCWCGEHLCHGHALAYIANTVELF